MLKRVSRKISPVSVGSSQGGIVGAGSPLTRLISGDSIKDVDEDAMWAKFMSVNYFQLSEDMRDGIKVRTHVHHFKSHKNVFLATEAVHWLIDNTTADNVAEAIFLANELISMGFIYNVAEEEREFRDNHDLYRFSCDDISERSKYMPEQLETMRQEFTHGITAFRASKPHQGRFLLQPQQQTNQGVIFFYGAEAVTWIIEAGWATKRSEAFRIAEIFAEDKVFVPYGPPRPSTAKLFVDDLVLYQLNDGEGNKMRILRFSSSVDKGAVPPKPRTIKKQGSQTQLTLPQSKSVLNLSIRSLSSCDEEDVVVDRKNVVNK